MAEPTTSLGEVLESRPGPSRLRQRWDALSPAGRRLAAAAAVVVVLGTGGLWLRDQAAERALAQRVSLTAALSVVSSSTSVPGGEVRWFVTVRNQGPRPVTVTAVEGRTDRLLLRSAGDPGAPIAPGRAVAVPVSVRLTCGAADGDGELRAEVAVRREDGGTASRRVEVGSAFLLVDVADTLCAVRPDLRDRELSGPVLAARAGE